MKLQLFLVTLIILGSHGRFLQSNQVAVTPSVTTHAQSLGCGACLYRGYTYCIEWSRFEHTNVTLPSNPTRCRITNDLDANQDWHCSTAYHDRAYAKYICDYVPAQCGGNQWNFTVAENSNTTITVSNLGAGNTCFYAFQTSGATLPALTVSSASNTSDWEVEYIEFGSNALNNSGVNLWGNTRTLSTAAAIQQSAPAWNAPPRFTRFSAAPGSATIFRQQIPTTSSVNATSGTVSGRYVRSIGGWKVHGMNDQQPVDYALATAPSSETRYVFVSVTSNAATALTSNIVLTVAALTHGVFLQLTGLAIALTMLVSWF